MSSPSREIVVLGGFGSSERLLQPLQGALEELGWHAKAFGLRYATENHHVISDQVAGRAVLTHSAGAMALAHIDRRPSQVIAVNAPVPRTIPQLLFGAMRLVAHNSATAITGPERLQHALIDPLKSIELISHAVRNGSMIHHISRFHAGPVLDSIVGEDVPGFAILAEHDEFYPPPPEIIERAKSNPRALFLADGHHDDLLTMPAQILPKVEPLATL